MDKQDIQDISLIFKVFSFSLMISLIVKYGGLLLSFTPSNLGALIVIFIPTLTVLSLLIAKTLKTGSP